MKNIPGARITFTKDDLSKLDEGQRKVVYIFAHILNRSKLLETQMLCQLRTIRSDMASETEKRAAQFGFLEFIILLAGELREGWEAVNNCYFKTQVSRTLNEQLPPGVPEAIKRLSGYFKGDGIMHRLRNDFSYHHSPDKIIATADKLSATEEHTAYLFNNDNNFFEYSAGLRMLAVGDLIDMETGKDIIDYLINYVFKGVYRDFSNALNAILATLLGKIDYIRGDAILDNVFSDNELVGKFFYYIDPEKL